MKRDWDVIREVLIEVEDLTEDDRIRKKYGGDPQEMAKSTQAFLLWKAGYLAGIDASTLSGATLIAPELTWSGHDLLDTLRSKPVWERIKVAAKEKGVELTFEAVKLLGKYALETIVRE